jgi:hypothetical protein
MEVSDQRHTSVTLLRGNASSVSVGYEVGLVLGTVSILWGRNKHLAPIGNRPTTIQPVTKISVFHVVPMSRILDLCLHSPIRLHDICGEIITLHVRNVKNCEGCLWMMNIGSVRTITQKLVPPKWSTGDWWASAAGITAKWILIACQPFLAISWCCPKTVLLIWSNSFFQTHGYVMDKEKPGQALCPYDPQHNSTAVFVGKFQTVKCYLMQ